MADITEVVGRESQKDMNNAYGIEQQIYLRFNIQHGLEYVGPDERKETNRAKNANHAPSFIFRVDFYSKPHQKPPSSTTRFFVNYTIPAPALGNATIPINLTA